MIAEINKMKSLLTILLIIISLLIHSQDSVAIKIIAKPITRNDTTYYLVRINWMDSKERVIVKCCCKDKAIRRKGEMIIVARKDLIFE